MLRVATDVGLLSRSDADIDDVSLEDINKSCLEQFRSHWQCLENNNQQLWQCRPDEWKLNKCVYENLVRRLAPPSIRSATDITPLEPREDYPRPAQAIDARAP